MQRKRRKRPIGRVKKEQEHNINNGIQAKEVRLVGENLDRAGDIVKTSEALKIAEQMEMDLVEVSPNADPPVCRIVDYNKFLYERKKREKEIKANAQKTVVKEIRFTSNTDDHDFTFKAKHAEEFINEGSKVRASVLFRGRAIMYKERGELILLKLADYLSEIAQIEQMPKMEGRKMVAFFTPKKIAKKKPAAKPTEKPKEKVDKSQEKSDNKE